MGMIIFNAWDEEDNINRKKEVMLVRCATTKLSFVQRWVITID